MDVTPTPGAHLQQMQLMQYEITLPADYDMGIIHHRVATRGSGTDGFPGLGIKAYLVRERGRHGSPVNQYAPFYLWSELSGMNQFLFGPGFHGIGTDFGRPAVRTWHGIAISDGPEHASTPVAATRTVQSIDPGLALRELHVADAQGRIHRELDAYILLMSRVRLLRPLAWLIGLPGLRRLLSALYRASVLRRLRASGRD
jgi:hypothetical protein